jgi:hypothetical protein
MEPLQPEKCYPYGDNTSLLGDIMAALTIPDPQSEERGIYTHGWISFIGWSAGLAVFLAYVVRPIAALFCSMFAPHIVVPEVPLSAMWPPVLAILGAGGTRVAGNFVKLREARKAQEFTVKLCADCPTRDCENCPLRALAETKGLPPRSTADLQASPAA